MFLLDTVVLSEYLRKRPSSKVINWLDTQPEDTLYISSLTVAELRKGYHKLQHKADTADDVKRAGKIDSWVDTLKQRFRDNIIPIDDRILENWSKMCGRAEAEGRKLPVIDSLLAASALTYSLIVVTRNVADFEKCLSSVDLYDPY